MIKELSIKTIKNGSNFISECKVLDTEKNKNYFVVSQLGSNLLYATFESSYLDYKLGKVTTEPVQVEGDNYWWWSDTDKFAIQYHKTKGHASSLQHRDYISRKYSHIKKPLGNIEYEIINKKQKDIFACGPTGCAYEIEFLLKKDNKHLFVYSDDIVSGFLLYSQSVINVDIDNIPDSIEEISCFKNAKKSQYYDLYLEMEKYKDNY